LHPVRDLFDPDDIPPPEPPGGTMQSLTDRQWNMWAKTILPEVQEQRAAMASKAPMPSPTGPSSSTGRASSPEPFRFGSHLIPKSSNRWKGGKVPARSSSQPAGKGPPPPPPPARPCPPPVPKAKAEPTPVRPPPPPVPKAKAEPRKFKAPPPPPGTSPTASAPLPVVAKAKAKGPPPQPLVSAPPTVSLDTAQDAEAAAQVAHDRFIAEWNEMGAPPVPTGPEEPLPTQPPREPLAPGPIRSTEPLNRELSNPRQSYQATYGSSTRRSVTPRAVTPRPTHDHCRQASSDRYEYPTGESKSRGRKKQRPRHRVSKSEAFLEDMAAQAAGRFPPVQLDALASRPDVWDEFRMRSASRGRVSSVPVQAQRAVSAAPPASRPAPVLRQPEVPVHTPTQPEATALQQLAELSAPPPATTGPPAPVSVNVRQGSQANYAALRYPFKVCEVCEADMPPTSFSCDSCAHVDSERLHAPVTIAMADQPPRATSSAGGRPAGVL
jgi:hypothetical protein